MGGKVPAEDMSKERVELLERARTFTNGMSKSHLLALIQNLAKAASECPRMSCTYCEHIARSEAHHQKQVGEAEAG